MSTQINKLSPLDTVALRGFDGFGASAAITKASATGFTVSGIFRAADDFAVLELFNSDDFFEHPRNKYLPDFSLSGAVLQFDVTYTNLHQLDSTKFPTIDWPYLDVARADGSSAQIPLFANATQAGGIYTPASTTITVTASPAAAFDRVTLWYKNNAADYNAAGGESAATVAAALAAAINTNWPDLTASAAGPNITITAISPGADGNLLTIYCQSKTGTLSIGNAAVPLTGGQSAATWRIRLDFTALGIDSVRQLWMTFAPPLANGAAFVSQEWTAVFTNWGIVSDPNGVIPLKVAGPGSVRVEEDDPAWVTYSGTGWSSTADGGFYSQGFAKTSSNVGDSVTVEYWCPSEHDLYLGTALWTDRAQASIIIDGDPASSIIVDTYLNELAPVVTRRLIASGLATGHHAVAITISGQNAASSGTNFYFDFIEAVVPSDVPDPLAANAKLSAALDYDTDSTYKLSPQRLLKTFDNLGLHGRMNLYLGVFWLWQRQPVGGFIPSVTIDFAQRSYSSGSGFGDGDAIFLNVAGQIFGKTYFPADSAESIAAHFAYYINGDSVGIWAKAAGSVLTITNRAAGTAFSFTFEAYTNDTSHPLTFSGALTGGVQPTWEIDPSQDPPITRGVRDWQADLYAEVAARGWGITTALSIEFVSPPDYPDLGQVWVQRFPDNTPVGTATGFSTLISMQGSFVAAVRLYQQRGFAAIAAAQTAAGLTPSVQFGEFSWWYFPNVMGMAFSDAETAAAAIAELGRSLRIFETADDDPAAWPLDVAFLAGRLTSHVQQIIDYLKGAFTEIECEWLLPMDVNYPTVVGNFNLGGRLLYAVNVPAALIVPASSPFDVVKIEALDFGAADRNMDLAQFAQDYPFGAGWPAAKLRYLVPCFNGGCPYPDELAQAGRFSSVCYWAKDHLELFGLDPFPTLHATAQLVDSKV